MTTRTQKAHALVQHVSVKANALVRLLLLVSTLLLFATGDVNAESKNGFDLSDSLIPTEKIKPGGPPRDGIPSIDNPKFVKPADVNFLKDKERVIGVYRNGLAKAYPIKILNWHEIVNDRYGEEAIVISYCPLCGTGMVFSAQRSNVHLTFGVSGLLYNSDVLLYDRQTGTLWSQIMGKGIAGPLKGLTLELLPASHTTWREWRKRHPETLILSTQTGYSRNYFRSPYMGYERSRELYFPVEHKSNKYRTKEMVLGVTIDGQHKAYPFKELRKQGLANFVDQFAGERLTIEWLESEKFARLLDENGTEVPSVLAYWFAWYAFYPETKIFQANP